MPDSTFKALSFSVQKFLGGRSVSLVREKKASSSGFYFSKPIQLGTKQRRIAVSDEAIKLSSLEEQLVDEIASAFEVLFNRFDSEGYKAHFRTAISASVIDIALARFLRGDRKAAFSSIQSLIQILKKLSFERYEGSPASTGFLICRTTSDRISLKERNPAFEWMPISPVKIDDEFFRGPLAYRYIDGYHSFFVADTGMKVVATIGHKKYGFGDAVDRLSYAEFYKILEMAGDDAFGMFLNNSSEVEIVLPKRKLIVWRKGVWSVFDPDVFNSFLMPGLNKDAIDDLIWTVYSLSKTRHGTLVLITDELVEGGGSVAGDHALSMELIERARNQSLQALKEDGRLIRMLSSDGLTIVNSGGELVNTGVIIAIAFPRKFSDKVTGGGRTAAAIAASYSGKVVKVSEDGPIELYEEGKRIFRFG